VSNKPVKGLPAPGGMWTTRDRERAARMLARLSATEQGPSTETWAEKSAWAQASAESLATRVGGGTLEPLPLARLRSAAQFAAWKEFFLECAERMAAAGHDDRCAKMVSLAAKADDTARLSELAAHQLAARQAEKAGWVDPTDRYMPAYETPIGAAENNRLNDGDDE
jgi:hypothetical protein